MEPTASIVIPTRERLPYLEVALASLCPQAQQLGAEVLLVDDGGGSAAARALAERFGARYLPQPEMSGLNAGRNLGVEASGAALVVFVDDDISARDGWLAALLLAAEEHPETDVFAGRITALLEGRPPRGCGRELPPITTLELGEVDLPTEFAWGSNMAIRRGALERVGPFDPSIGGGGDEQEWQERAHRLTPGRAALYVAQARVDHRRSPGDARLSALCRAAFARGRGARAFDARSGRAPRAGRELLTLCGCLGHVVRRRCMLALTMVAHSAGRLRQALGEASSAPQPDSARPGEPDFLSGASGTVGGLDGLRRRALDQLAIAGELVSARRLRLGLAARSAPPRRRVLVLSVERPEHAAGAAAIRSELMGSRHEVTIRTAPPGELGKFENLNRMLRDESPADYDWLVVLDDDIELPRGFLDRFVFLCERFSLTLAQPAHRLHSHAAWAVTRRRPGSVVRETRFVEIGPVTAFARASFPELLPFPELRMGWGLDLHWAALAAQRGWRCGVVDAVCIRHRQAPAGAGYPRAEAIAEAEAFLAGRPYLKAAEAELTLATHNRW